MIQVLDREPKIIAFNEDECRPFSFLEMMPKKKSNFGIFFLQPTSDVMDLLLRISVSQHKLRLYFDPVLNDEPRIKSNRIFLENKIKFDDQLVISIGDDEVTTIAKLPELIRKFNVIFINEDELEVFINSPCPEPERSEWFRAPEPQREINLEFFDYVFNPT